jgi:hypothetical protein
MPQRQGSEMVERTAAVETAPGPQPSSEAIAKRAYELYLQRGSVSGYELEDWLQAEAELTAAAAAAAAAATASATR